MKKLPCPSLVSALIIVLSALFFFIAQTAFARDANTKQKKELIPKTETTDKKEAGDPRNLTDTALQVVSDKMIAQQDGSVVEFIGNARATREDSIVTADSIKIFFHTSDTKQEDQNNVKEIVSAGNVEYTSGERKAFADKAVYTVETEILVLTGKSPRLVTGESHVTGKKITLFRKEDKVVVESDDKTRVQAVFNPEDPQKGKNQ